MRNRFNLYIFVISALIITACAATETGLIKAAGEGDMEKVRVLLAEGADVKENDKDGQTALMGAAEFGHTATVETLLEAGADVNAKDVGGGTALMQAARYGHTATVETLLEAGADVNAKDVGGGTALMQATSNGHTATVEALLDGSAQLDMFMKKWSEYKPFQVPMDPKDEPLLQAALKKDPKGPWATYFSMKFAQTVFEARNLSNVDRVALYGASLTYLKPARDILALSMKADPDNKELQLSLNQLGEQIALASLEAGLDFAAVKSFAEATLAKNKDTQSQNYGNIIFNEHTLLGRVALREGKLDEAKKHLLTAGHTPGSPQLDSFGPDFILARELAEKGEHDTVIAFLDLVARFWANPLLESWKKQLRAGKVPDHPKWR